MTAVSNGSMQDLGRELTLDELEAVSGGFRVGPIAVEDGIVAIGIPGVAGIFVGGGCIGGWLGDTAVGICGK
jgi:hypothetical protein